MFRPSLTGYNNNNNNNNNNTRHFDFVARAQCVNIVIDDVNAQTRRITMLTASDYKTQH